MTTGAPHVVDAVKALDPLLAELSRADAVAVDTEFHAEGRYFPDPMLLQLATRGHQAWLVDPRSPAVVDALAPALRDVPRWIVHGGDRDLLLLDRLLGGVPAEVHDTQVLAGLVDDAHPAGLATLLTRWLGVAVDKSTTLTDWSTRPLDEAQRRYAAEDVDHLFALHDRLWDAVKGLGRQEIADAACAEARERSLAVRPDIDAWRLVATHARDPSEAAIVQALLVWRDAEARRVDKPPGYILADTLVRRIARTAPQSVDDLARDRRLRSGLLRRHGDAIVKQCRGAEPGPSHQVCPRHTPAARRMAWLRMTAAAIGHEDRFAPDLVLPEPLAHQLAACTPADHPPSVPGWRGALLGTRFAQVSTGAIPLRWKDGDVRSEHHSRRLGGTDVVG